MWPELEKLTAAPLKDLRGKMVLRWSYADLRKVASTRLEHFLRDSHSDVLDRVVGRSDLLDVVLPPTITNRLGVTEPALFYILRHTQLLPRQVLYVLNEAVHRALVDLEKPFPTGRHILDAVEEAESNLVPEIFSAHRFRYEDAAATVAGLIPKLPFQFSDGDLHRACRELGVGDDYRQIRTMLDRPCRHRPVRQGEHDLSARNLCLHGRGAVRAQPRRPLLPSSALRSTVSIEGSVP